MYSLRLSLLLCILSNEITNITAFSIQDIRTNVARPSQTQLHFGIPTFGAKDNKEDEGKDEEKKINASGLFQLITAGMGSPFLGDFEGVDKETGNFMFSLEANNLVDEVCVMSHIFN